MMLENKQAGKIQFLQILLILSETANFLSLILIHIIKILLIHSIRILESYQAHRLLQLMVES